jgi:peptide/nickel transport system substrate-binding protein
VRIRRAIAHAIDRTKLIVVATHGAGIQVEGDQPENGWAYDRKIRPLSYDPREAQRLLDQAGWHTGAGGFRRKNGRPLEIGLAIAPQGINGSGIVATTVQRYLAVVGIDVAIKQYAPGLMWEPKAAGGILSNGRYQMAYNAWWTLGPDPDDTFNFACDQQPPQGENSYFWCNRTADSAMHDALRTVDVGRRARDYAIVQQQLMRDLPEITLWQLQVPDATRIQIRNFSPSPTGSTFWNASAWQL